MKKESKKRVIVGISGGVDSSVAIALLKEQGFSVVGVFMKFWEEGKCCNSESQRRARYVCSKLDVPFYVINIKDRFEKEVVNYFIDSYKNGETPNPCVVCNREIKFKTLIESLTSFNADYVATGHYIRINEDSNSGEKVILRGKDKNKDQSYFLWSIKKEWLKKIIFPIGELDKKEVRRLAEKFELSTSKTKESQEVCFVKESVPKFLKNYLKESPGDIVDTENKKIGRHSGLFNYTIGQRKGLDLSGGPFYVVEKNSEKNILIVTKQKEKMEKEKIFFEKENFFEEVSFPFKAEVQIRYNGKRAEGIVDKNNVSFLEPVSAVASGQSVVFYKGEKLLGGGIIK